jgi:hypothetical protein
VCDACLCDELASLSNPREGFQSCDKAVDESLVTVAVLLAVLSKVTASKTTVRQLDSAFV